MSPEFPASKSVPSTRQQGAKTAKKQAESEPADKFCVLDESVSPQKYANAEHFALKLAEST